MIIVITITIEQARPEQAIVINEDDDDFDDDALN